MRKPLVVVCAMAAAMIAGGIAATTAGAQATPGAPGPTGVPALTGVALPEVPQFSAPPQLPANAGDTGLPGPPATDRPGDHAAPATPDPPAQHRTTAPNQPHHPGRPDRPDQPDRSDQPGDPDQSDGQGHGAPAKPVVQRPAAAMATAHRDVTPDSVSTNPSAPVQQQVLALVNDDRERGGCGDLTLDRRLILAAQGHAVDMARTDYFAHESPDGQGAGDRVSGAGYHWRRYGENIARGQDSPYEVVDGWMHSPEHRENIMDCDLHQMGVGLAFDGADTPYWVQDFATPLR
jgi:uncharacterized protein YkwD